MDKVEKGKRLFLIMAIIYILFDVLVIFFSYDTLGSKSITSGIVRLVIEVFLLRSIYNGSKVARVILLILLGLAIMAGLVIIVTFENRIVNLFVLSVMALYSWMIYVIERSPSFKAYLSSLKDN